jgi:UDP-N-acetylglucosamine 4,6-dehydratase
MINQTILIFGGTGSLGKELNKRYKDENIIYNFSRDENKHWQMKIQYNNHPNIKFIIGNVADKELVKRSIIRTKPTIIIIGSAMKHIDQCEINTGESIKNNLLGTQNILDVIEENKMVVKEHLKTVLFVSSDKACSPVNNYGFCKAMSETLVVEKAFFVPEIKFINVRYGNVLNSSGSIIPLLNKIGNDENYSKFTLTSDKMTRFVMTLEQSGNLIEYAILNGETGDTVIPKLVSMKLIDLFELFSKKYNKPIEITGIRAGEKLLESLINETQSSRVVVNNDYTHIKSALTTKMILNENIQDYNSKMNTLTKDELEKYLINLGLY